MKTVGTKLELQEKLFELGEVQKEIKIYEVAKELNINHMSRQDVMDICSRFLKSHPDYRLVQFVDRQLNNQSLFTTAVLTCCEYD